LIKDDDCALISVYCICHFSKVIQSAKWKFSKSYFFGLYGTKLNNGEKVFIGGNKASLGFWDPGKVGMDRMEEKHWEY
jgi:hypothetical protein